MNDQKHLGLILDQGLSFEKHLNEKITKAKKNIGLIKHLSKYLPLKTLDQMYKALVRPHLDYCDIIYHEPSKINQPPLGVTLTSPMEKVERIQYQAALAISRTWKHSSRTKLYEELGWESLYDRRICHRILQVQIFTRSKMACPPLTLITNFLLIMKIPSTPSMNFEVEQIGTRRSSFQIRLPLGTYIFISHLLVMLPICQPLSRLKTIFHFSFDLKRKVFLEFTIL